MAVPFLHNIDLNENQLLNAKVHTDTTAPSNPGTGSIWFDTNTNLLKIYRGGSWNNLFVKTEAIADAGTNLATADQIHTFVTSGVVDPVQFDGTFTVGVDDTGYDVKFFGATSGKYMLWDESADTLDIQGEITVGVGSDKLKLYGGGSQAVIAGTVNTQGIALEVLDSSGNSSRPIIVSSTGISGTAIKDEDNMSSNSANHLATQQSIKAYVDAQVTAQDLDFSGDSGTGSVDLDSQTFAITGDTGITTTASGQGLSIDLDDTAVTAATYGSATAIPQFTVDAQGRLTAASENTISTSFTISDGTNTDVVNTGETLTFYGTPLETTVGISNNEVTIGLPDNVTVGGNLIVSGNLTINGTTTDIDTTNLVVEDPLIKLAKLNNSSDSLDIGFYGLYDTAGTDKYAGLFRDASDSSKFKLFKDLETEPTTTVDTGGTGYATGTLVANIEGDLTGTILTASQTNITGVGTITTGTWAATDIAIAHGGTGASDAATAFSNLKQAATTSATGVVELATATEAQGGAVIGKVIDAAQLGSRSVVATIDVSNSTFVSNKYAEITHNLGGVSGNSDVVVQLYDITTEETVYADVARTDKTGLASTNKVKVSFAQVPTNDIRVVIASNKGATAGTIAYS